VRVGTHCFVTSLIGNTKERVLTQRRAMSSDPIAEFAAALATALAELRVTHTVQQIESMSRHYVAMVEANRQFNLTRITDPVEAAVKHYADSLAMLRLVEDRGWRIASLLDIGTGAGFPAIPLAIMRPDWRMTAIDGTMKKVGFVQGVAKELGLTNLNAVHAHSEHWKGDERFDIVTGRAVAKLDEFVSLADRFASSGGKIVMYKTDPMPASEAVASGGLPNHLQFDTPLRYELTIGEERIARALHVVAKP